MCLFTVKLSGMFGEECSSGLIYLFLCSIMLMSFAVGWIRIRVAVKEEGGGGHCSYNDLDVSKCSCVLRH